MSWDVVSSKVFLILVRSQPSWLTSCETISVISGLVPSLGLGMKLGRSGIQGSSHILTVFPFPINMQALRASRDFIPSKLLQILEEDPTVLWFSQLPLTFYFALSTFTHKLTFSERIHQANLESRA